VDIFVHARKDRFIHFASEALHKKFFFVERCGFAAWCEIPSWKSRANPEIWLTHFGFAAGCEARLCRAGSI